MNFLSNRWARRSALALVLLLGAGFAVGSLEGSRNDSPSTAFRSVAATDTMGGGAGTTQSVAGLSSRVVGDTYNATATAAAPAAQGGSSSALPPLPDRIIKNGDVSVEVSAKSFDASWSRVADIASRFGGFVASSSRGSVQESSRDRARAGEIVVRVPAGRFDAAMAELRKIGRVVADNVNSQDVTEEFTDLESRLRNLKAQEAVLLRLMGTAKTVQDTLVVQERMAVVQGEIEQVQGRLKVLRSLTQLSAITVRLAEPGAGVLPGDGGPSFTEAWDTAIEGLERLGTVVLIGAIWLAPFALLAAVVLSFLRRRPPAVTEQS